MIYIVDCSLFKVIADLLQLASSRAGIIQQVAQLTRVRLDLDGIFLMTRVAFENQDLVLWPKLLADCLHCENDGLTANALVRVLMLRMSLLAVTRPLYDIVQYDGLQRLTELSFLGDAARAVKVLSMTDHSTKAET